MCSLQQIETQARARTPPGRETTRLRFAGMRLPPEIAPALFPDIAIERGRRGSDRPLLRLGPGLLRAPPHYRDAAALSALALTLSGPPSAVDCLDPARILVQRGWETAELIARAKAARRALLAARIGSM